MVNTFVEVGGAVEIVIDETLERRWGRKVNKRGLWAYIRAVWSYSPSASVIACSRGVEYPRLQATVY